jgi:hypothetical protein
MAFHFHTCTLVLNISEQFQLRQQILLLIRRFAFDDETNLNSMFVIERKTRLKRIAGQVRLHTINIGIDELVRVITSCNKLAFRN